MKEVVLVCEDLFGLEICTILQETNRWLTARGREPAYQIAGLISDSEDPFRGLGGKLKRLGPVSGWRPMGGETYVMGLRMPAQKQAAAEQLLAAGCRFETVRAPWMNAPALPAGEGCVLAAYTVKAGMTFGRFVTVIAAALSRRSVGDFSTVLHFANVTGNVGACSYVGSHAYTHLGKDVGDRCFVADGSVVVNHVKSGTAVAGVPARRIHDRKEMP